MKMLQNLHTHTTYCDGADTPREMIEGALEKGFTSLGFSGHSYTFFHGEYCMSKTGMEEYKREITALKGEYADKIKIFLGLEADMLGEIDLSGYDYLIGSAHYLKYRGELVDIDRSAPNVQSIIDEYFGGDGIAYAKAYYEQLAFLPSVGKFDIIGHFDLITKHLESTPLFDWNSPQYLGYGYDAIDALAGKIPFFEVNTGAIARGYRTTPYPSIPFMKRFLQKGYGAVVTSDCHDQNKLDLGFELAVRLLKEAGFKERYLLTDEGFVPIPL